MNYSLISLSWTVPNYSWKLSACCQEMSHWPLCVLVGGKESCSREKIKLCFHRKQEMNLSVVSYDSFKAQYCQRNTVCMDVWQSTDPAVRDPKYFLMESKHAEVCSKGERLSLSSKVLNNYTFCYSRKKKVFCDFKLLSEQKSLKRDLKAKVCSHTGDNGKVHQ